MRKMLCIPILLLCYGVVQSGDFTPTTEPVAPDGTKAICDIPNNQHIKNTGGMGRGGPGTGDGLCVFSATEVSSRWHNIKDLAGFQKWMMNHPGGGWPEKLDKMLAQFCKEKGVDVPPYIQHVGGDESFLDLCMKTDRMVAVTYCGRDDFYAQTIAHMVVLCHIDSQWAAINDNNRVSKTVWMSRSDFLKRWRGNSGGWAVAFAAPPPPSYPETKTVFGAKDVDGSCICGDNCKCEKGKCPNKCPVSFGQCPGGKCPTVVPTNPFNDGLKLLPEKRLNPQQPIGNPPSDEYVWAQFDDGTWGWRFRTSVPEAAPKLVPVVELDPTNYGVDTAKIHGGKRYTLSGGVEITEAQAQSILVGNNGIKDDSDRWHLSAVGDDAFLKTVKSHIDGLPTATKGHLHVQFYNPTDWPVAKYSLPLGVSLRKPSPGRVSEQVGVVVTSDYGLDKLLALLEWLNGKPKPPVPPMPQPPTPNPTPSPTPNPQPTPVPSPLPTPSPLNLPLVALILGILYFLLRK